MATNNSFEGGCLCGAVRFVAQGEPTDSLLCHCRMCQRASGAPVTALLFVNADQFAITRGQTRQVPFSPRAWRHICNDCAAPVFFTRDARPDRRAIYAGALDEPGAFPPRLHVCVSSAVGWLDIRDDAPRYDDKPAGMAPTVGYEPTNGRVTLRE